jgi:glycosyltransferase involved in cell wall biosynthesis
MDDVRDTVDRRATGTPAAVSGSRSLALDVLSVDPPKAVAGLHVAYLVNQYPKVSHSFIRREILALEQQGVRVDRIAIRGWDADVVDPVDIAELSRTQYVLKGGILPLCAAMARVAFAGPRQFLSALGAAIGMARSSERSLPYHLVYFAQACLILEWLRASGARHLHAHFGTNPAEVAMLVRLLGGPPYSYTAHGPEENDRGAFLGIDRKVRHAKFVAAISSHTRSQILRRADLDDWSKIKVVHCGLEPEFHAAAQQRSIPQSPSQTLVCVARLDPEKGQLMLLEAMQRVRVRFPECRLVLVGDGEMRKALEARRRALGLDQHVTVTGWMTSAQVRDQILAARALVLPSFQEGLPVVIMEAMALRRPVIATYIAGIPELVRHGIDGWLVPAGDIGALADAMETCLNASGADLDRIGDDARNRVVARHDIDHEASKLAGHFAADSDAGRAKL